jgi:P4 family phage/plasmid primase-like protien
MTAPQPLSMVNVALRCHTMFPVIRLRRAGEIFFDKDGKECTATGKEPNVSGWTDMTPWDLRKTERMYAGDHAQDNCGARMGQEINRTDSWLFTIDEDQGGAETVVQWATEGKTVPTTYEQRTWSGKRHRVFRSPRPIAKSIKSVGHGIDIVGCGGQIVFSGSIVGGVRYKDNGHPIVDAPDWLLDLCTTKKTTERKEQAPVAVDPVRAESRAEFYLLHEAPLAIEGSGGDETTYKVAARCKDFGVDEPAATVALMVEHWNARCQPPWTVSDLEKKINHAYKYGTEPIGVAAPEAQFSPIESTDDEPSKYSFKKDWSDTGNKNVFVSESRGNWRYVPETNTGLWWSGKHWKEDRANKYVTRVAARVAEYYRAEIERRNKDLSNKAGDARKAEEKAIAHVEAWERTCRNRNGTGGILNMIAMAKTDDRVLLELDQLNVSRHLMGVANGVVDLRTGKLCDTPRGAYITKQSPFPFDPDATAPLWDRIISEVTGVPGRSKDEWEPQPEVADYLHRMAGYMATGETGLQKFSMWVGNGANGKSVVADILLSVYGEYGWVASPDLLIQPSFSGDAERATPQLAALVGKRAVFCSEGRPGQKLDMGVVKRHTGEEKLTCRRLHGSPFSFVIHHKLTYLTNVVPALDHVDEASIGRLHILEFLRTWNRSSHTSSNPLWPDADPDLKKKLLAEAPGILTRIVTEARRYYEAGLTPPSQVRAKTQGYIHSQDGFGQWLRDACERRSEGQIGWTAAKEALSQYNAFAARNEYVTMTPNAFSAAVARHHIGQKKTRTGVQYGIRILVQDFDQELEPAKREPAKAVADRLILSVNQPVKESVNDPFED